MEDLHWVGPIADSSGYGEATRNYIVALLKHSNLSLSVEGISFEKEKTQHAKLDLITPLIKPRNSKIQVVHLTPENYSRFRKPGVYNIGYTAWETDRIPPHWIPECNLMNEIWVPSSWNVEVFKNSGVTVPIYRIPHGFEAPDLESVKKLDVLSDTFVFYSIMQWIERKAPLQLLTAYFTEFEPDEKIALILKTYRKDTSSQERENIKQQIALLKQSLNLTKFPSVKIIGHLLTSDQINSLHKRGNCFVLPHRGEGFGIPLAEAMSFGNPVISTNYSGNIDFMNRWNSYLIGYQLTPVRNMSWMPHYTGKMIWADPNVIELKRRMRWVFDNQEKAAKVGQKGKEEIAKNYSWQRIADIISERFNAIKEKVNG